MIRRIILLIAIFIMSVTVAQAKTEKFGTWVDLEFRKDFLESFSFSITPKLRAHDYFTDKSSIHILGIEYRLKF